jgi:hypothetical protein
MTFQILLSILEGFSKPIIGIAHSIPPDLGWAEVGRLGGHLLDSTAGPLRPAGSAPRTLRGGEFDWGGTSVK